MRRVNIVKMTSAMDIDSRAKELAKYHKVYNLSAGDPNILLDTAIVQSYKQIKINNSHNYCSSQGIYELRQKLGKPENVLISNGAKELIYLALLSVTRPCDEVVLIGPCWSSYVSVCKMLNLNYKLLIGDEEHQYVPSLDQIDEAITRDTSAVLFNNPNNPTGVVYNVGTVSVLSFLCKQRDVWLISDEIYSDLIYENKRFTSLKGESNVIYINGFSKSYGLTGWRIGYAIAPINVIEAMTACQSQISGPPNTLVQKIILNCYDKLKPTDTSVYKERIKILAECDEFFDKRRPEGGLYFYLPTNRDSYKLCEEMLEQHHIALTPGDEYGVPNTIRLSISSISTVDLIEILPILKEKLVF